MKKRGFTLVELLIVISIIGVLASVVLAGVGNARVAARDAARTSDIRAVITALEIYRTQNGQYPTADLTVSNPACGSGYCLATISALLVSAGFLPQIPADPTYNNSIVNYRYCGNATNYTIMRRKEATNTWCIPPGQPALHLVCGSPPNQWHTRPSC